MQTIVDLLVPKTVCQAIRGEIAGRKSEMSGTFFNDCNNHTRTVPFTIYAIDDLSS